VLRPDHPHAVRIRRFEAAAGANGPADVAATYAPDVVVHAGSGPVGGSTRGRQALLERIAATARVSGGTLRGEPLHVAASDAQAVVVFRVTARRGPRALDVTLLEVWRLDASGRAVEIWDHFPDREARAAWDRFWNEPALPDPIPAPPAVDPRG
jgi:hypothetical protein